MDAKWMLAALVLLAPSAAGAQQLCGSSTVTASAAEIFVTVNQRPGRAAIVDYVMAKTFSADRSFALEAGYAPAEDTLGPPDYVSITAYMPLPDPARAQPERIVMRIGDGPWSGAPFMRKPDRAWGDPKRIEGYLSAIIGPEGSAQLRAAIERSDQVDVRRLDPDGRTLGEAAIRFTAAPSMWTLYAKARKAALADLKPCGPPLVIPPAKP